MKKGKISVGIAGLGRSGWDIHALLLEALETKYEIAAVFDKDPARMREAQEKFGCESYHTYQALLKNKNVELVVVAMPSHLHAKYSIDAINAGKDVVCEKPMATTLKDADRMIATAKRKKRILSIFQNRRYSPDFRTVQKVINTGVLGRIVHVRMAWHGFGRRWDWQTLKKYGGGTLNNACPHAIDHALVIFGESRPKVFCLRDRTLTLGDADDHVKIILYGENAPTVEVEVTSACTYGQDSWLVMGTHGGLSGTSTSLKWKYFKPKDLPKRIVDERPTPDRSYNMETIPFIEKSWDIGNDKSPGQKGFYLDLYNTIRNGTPLVITSQSVRRQMLVMEQCRQMAPV